MSLLDNARLGLHGTKLGWRIPWSSERNELRLRLADFGLEIDPDIPAGHLAPAEQTLLAIIRALGHHRASDGGTLLVLDEPTAYLPIEDRERLYESVRLLAASGLAVAFSTHDMDEARQLGDRITVLRDSVVAANFEASEVDEESLVRALLGREMESYFPETFPTPSGEVILSARDLTDDFVRDVSFDLRAGEIIGLTGLVGMGQDRIPYMLFGHQPWKAGAVAIAGKEYKRIDPGVCLRNGIGLLPANRQRHSGVQGATLRENLTIPYLQRFYLRGFLRSRQERDHGQDLLSEFGVRPRPDPDLLLSQLSEGNQQRALIANG